MTLPNASDAVIDVRKLTDYLLSLAHPVGSSKARLLRGLGFDDSNVALLEQEIRHIAQIEDVVETVSSAHGEKYVVDGIITSPLGYQMRVRTVWITETGESAPRFVTAYPRAG